VLVVKKESNRSVEVVDIRSKLASYYLDWLDDYVNAIHVVSTQD
jgi:hypothetical protein